MATALFLAALVQGTTTHTGDLTERIRYTIVSRPEIGARTGPLTLVLLWRGEPGWTTARSAAESQRIDSLVRWRLVSNSTTVVTNGKMFPLASHTDSALVVMVDFTKPDSQRTASTLIASASLPAEFWPKTWYSGDTTFTVSPSFGRRMMMLWNALGTSPAIANFLVLGQNDGSPRIAGTRVVGPFPVTEQTIAAFIPAVPAVDTAGACLSYTTTSSVLRGVRMLSYYFGPPDKAWRRVNLGLDSLGRVSFYSDLRGSALTGPTPARDAGLGTSINFSATSTGIMASNFNSDVMPGRYRLFGDRALQAPNLGPIGPMIDRIRKECDR